MMPLRSLRVQGYRSIQRVFLRLGQVNVIVGPNGCGKSNLYRSLYLLAQAADGRLARTLADEGGMPSALWAGEQYKGDPRRVSIDLKFDRWSYSLSLGLPQPERSLFQLDPVIREEELCCLDGGRSSIICRRKNGSARVRDDEGKLVDYPGDLNESESIVSEIREPRRFPELMELRSTLLGWRFYHQFRTDVDSPLRRPRVAVRTPVLSQDGGDLAAALRTIQEIGDHEGLAAAVADAFAGGSVDVDLTAGGMEVQLRTQEFKRPFVAAELSDGTLKYLCLLAALLSPRPPTLLAINEPDANLHPRLFEPLAKLVARAAKHSQLWITTHSEPLAELLQHHANALLIRLEKQAGATRVLGVQADGRPEADDGESRSPNADSE
ncbi:MAG: AAA family ATPase [Planctomycetaceae bacterium]|nr:AAA family ATPase [Planctomycetaceae bacterium]